MTADQIETAEHFFMPDPPKVIYYDPRTGMFARHRRENFVILALLVILLTGFSGMLLAQVVHLNKVVADTADMCVVQG